MIEKPKHGVSWENMESRENTENMEKVENINQMDKTLCLVFKTLS